MLKRPSSRRKSGSEQIQLNLVPILDTMVTLVAFLLFTSSFMSLVSIETVAPIAANAKEVQEKVNERPLQLTVSLKEGETEIWSPFGKIQPKHLPNLPDGQPDLAGLHSALIEVKAKFPTETKVVLAPDAGTAYDLLIAVMDAVRGVDPGDPPLYSKDAQGNDVPLKALFPEVVFGNLLGGA